MIGQPLSKPLTSISPTAFNTAVECKLKAIWQLSGNPPLLPASPKASIGSVAHQIISEAGSGRLPPQDNTIRRRWEELIDLADARIAVSTVGRHLSPLRQSVPDIDVRRIRATRKALDIAHSSTPSFSRSPKSAARPSHGYEIPVRSLDGIVQGTIDAVLYQGPDETTIQDFKSGPIMDTDEDGITQPRTSYRVQLKMYAALYAETFGRWPKSLQLVPMAGTTTEVAFDANECLSLVNQAKNVVKEINESISEHSPETLQFALAQPSPNACRYCHYRPACLPYRSHRSGTLTDTWPIDLIGTVRRVTELGNSKLMLELAIHGDSVKIPGLSPGNRHPFLTELTTGETAGAFNLYQRRPQSPFSESLFTTIHHLPKSE